MNVHAHIALAPSSTSSSAWAPSGALALASATRQAHEDGVAWRCESRWHDDLSPVDMLARRRIWTRRTLFSFGVTAGVSASVVSCVSSSARVPRANEIGKVTCGDLRKRFASPTPSSNRGCLTDGFDTAGKHVLGAILFLKTMRVYWRRRGEGCRDDIKDRSAVSSASLAALKSCGGRVSVSAY